MFVFSLKVVGINIYILWKGPFCILLILEVNVADNTSVLELLTMNAFTCNGVLLLSQFRSDNDPQPLHSVLFYVLWLSQVVGS